MRRKQRMKRCAALFMGLAMGLMFSMNAMAASSQEVTLAGAKIEAKSYVTVDLGVGSTESANYTSSVWATVSGTYTYIHPINGDRGTYLASNQNVSGASIAFSPPGEYRSLSIQCHHTASNNGQQWSCDTQASYYP